MDITVFADLIKVRMEMKSYWIMVGPNSSERGPGKRQTRTPRHLKEPAT